MLDFKKFFNRKLNKKSKNTSKEVTSSAPVIDKIIDTKNINSNNIVSSSESDLLLEEGLLAGGVDGATDDNKRLFLKIAGVAGLGLAASALFPKSADAYVAGSTPTSGVVGLKDSYNTRIDPAQETGGNLAFVKTNTDPLVASGAGGYIRQDSNATIAKETGGNLASIKTNTDNLVSINSSIAKFKFDGDNLLISGGTGGGGGYEIVGLKDLYNNRVNPATDESLVLLRRMVKIMESQSTVDLANRQRITLDAIGTGTPTALGTTMPVSGTVALGAGAAAIGSVTIGAGAATIGVISNLQTLAGQNQQMYQDPARNAFANGIRQNLSFS